MKLAFVLMDATFGGHTRTAVTIGDALRQRGHDVRFIVGTRSTDDLVRRARFRVDRLRDDRLGRVPGLTNHLCRNNDEIVHIFGRQGLTSALRACRRLSMPFYWTICGGAPQRGVPAGGHIVSLSHEVASDLVARNLVDDRYVTIEPARLDIESLERSIHAADTAEHGAFRRANGLDDKTKIVVRVSRMARAYGNSISQTGEAVAGLSAEGLDVAFVHIGYVSAGGTPVRARIREEFEQLNQRCGRVVAVTTDTAAAAPLPYLRMATAAIGTGRTAFEAMLAGLPTLVVGVGGFAGAATNDNACELAKYNFSGRNILRPLERPRSVAAIRDTLRPLIADRDDSQDWLGAEWVHRNLDVRRAAATYEAIYGLPQGPLPDAATLLRYDVRTIAERVGRRVLAMVSRDWLPNCAKLSR